MGGRQRRLGWLGLGVWLLLALAASYFLLPAQLGGQTDYLITHGTSMQPMMHDGDLVLIRRAADYRVGDIIAYHLTPQTIALHRIVARDGGRLTLKGDNNTWLDSTRPSTDEVVGRLWIHLPAAGKLLRQVRTPLGLAILTFLAGVMTQTMSAGSRRRKPTTGALQPADRPSGNGRADVWGQLLALVVVLTLGFALLGVLAFGRSAVRAGFTNVTYDQTGAFSYSAPAPLGIYSGDRAVTGDPLYLQVVHELDVQFDYRFASQASHSIEGTYQLVADIRQENGWARTAQVVPETPFSGDNLRVTGRIDLAQVQAILDTLAQQTGVKDEPYTLAIRPILQVHGSVVGENLDETFAPALLFRQSPMELVLDKGTGGSSDPLHATQSGLVKRPRGETNVFSILGVQIPVPWARSIAVTGLVLAAGSLLLLAVLLRASLKGSEPTRIRARYAALLLDLHSDDASRPAGGAEAAQVGSIEGLVKLARQEGRLIVHEREGTIHRYVVAGADRAYAYTIWERY